MHQSIIKIALKLEVLTCCREEKPFLLQGNCLEQLKKLEDNSIDSIVTDPPYGLSFMGKKWDYDVPSTEIWKECLRVLKPGGHLLSFGGTRTYHRLVVNIEDAGFEIRDCIQWLYGSGFPKSTDVSKRIDKEAGAERKTISTKTKNTATHFYENGAKRGRANYGVKQGDSKIQYENVEIPITCPATDQAKQWQGWGTALKPANEPICVARKPLEKGLTVAENVQKWGCGAINIDGSRIGISENDPNHRKPSVEWQNADDPSVTNFGSGGRPVENLNTNGRWPANIILDEEAAAALDEQSGDNVSRFFYVAKASKRERGTGNNHPTIKPIKLMEYLIKLITPPNGTVLDPFMGSGSTGVAAKGLGFNFVGIELSDEYFKIARERISGVSK